MTGMATMAYALLIAAAAMSAAVGAARRNEDCDLYGMNCEGPSDSSGESFFSRSEEIFEQQTDDTDTEEGELSATYGVSSKQRMFSLAQQKVQQAKNMVKASSKMTADALKAVNTIQQQLVNKAKTGQVRFQDDHLGAARGEGCGTGKRTSCPDDTEPYACLNGLKHSREVMYKWSRKCSKEFCKVACDAVTDRQAGRVEWCCKKESVDKVEPESYKDALAKLYAEMDESAEMDEE
ncbi:unnamed protein product [Vitrella brassicaformis CCMP3155]|uniref:Uncharacterized protein n=1 Tax=Vitrella brassicaformis (strain CCMP3155) TaxID=1169540 RepID=A0A0G4EYB9_VITBC|nr:unnamed protein product [Vitrella brassicaformis CCMP3155]|eukprot:CEM04135.1 unnamed protein product [Vitrella brassicaformis CCMP3155]